MDVGLLDHVLGKYAGSRTRVFTESYRLLLEKNGADPFSNVKQELNEAALAGLNAVHRVILEDTGKLLSTIALANSVDLWLPGKQESIQGLELGGEAVVESDAVARVEEARSIVYLLDNSGEAVVDLAAALVLASYKRKVTVIARNAPYEVDVTLPEARVLLGRVAEKLGYDPRLVELAGTGSIYPAPLREAVDGKVAQLIEEADIVISKGIANLEAFLENCPSRPGRVVVALRAKCSPVSRLLGVPRGHGVARILRCPG